MLLLAVQYLRLLFSFSQDFSGNKNLLFSYQQKISSPLQGKMVLFYHKSVRRLEYMMVFFQVET